ncbi:hypothetical protein [Pseudoflavonifractor sp.]|jgi:hypothetical protein|uniref:hypothetical protein n=1 Tax=Pseudoflavonifractor sp. TaxID=1980281 RepID=UPI003D90F704
MKKHNMAQSLDRALDGLRFRADMREQVLQASEHPVRRPGLPRRAAAALAVCAALVIAAAAAGPTLWKIIQEDLGSRAPYVTEVLGGCEDQGVRMEVQAALADSRLTRLYFTMEDLTGELFHEDTACDLLLSLETGGTFSWGNGGSGLKVLDYDPERHLATLVYSRGTDELSQEPPTRAKLDMTYLLPGERSARIALDGTDIPSSTLESTTPESGATVLLPGQTPLLIAGNEQLPGDTLCPVEESDHPDVFISSMGFATDGRYHIRFAQSAKVSSADASEYADQPVFSVEYYLYDPEDPNRWPSQGVGDAVWTAVEGGWDVCLPSLTEDTLPYLNLLALRAHYSVAGGRIEGNWEITVPVEAVEQRTAAPAETVLFPYTRNGELPYGRDWDAQLDQVTVSPLSICADFSTPDGQEYPCQLTGSELSLAVSLSDGTTLAPAYCDEVWSQRVGWVMWEFNEPIDLSLVESVTLNGETIPLS